MKEVEGDLIAMACAGELDVIVHGCNCFHEMGRGIAAAIAAEFPQAVAADRETPKGDRDKLGTVSTARAQRDGHRIRVVNAYTQFHWTGREGTADYDAIERAFAEVARRFPDRRIGYPKIGAGMGGGDWDEIATRIDRALEGRDHRLVVLP
ncbi:macro domain-containing protein [Psychromarinibacter sp. C21-152]|uniref:Macro domain-containing protein n=1 Tax=Psychromarinibacter sediminicola TaxID=3033385 RepID=A0AAE3NVZ0_9RHOB|nr:macro domain-containing protein [Psychromarinibacter sediminicola]MDF0603132.1 macro domain-containing protein [Psychromarinibacter sediminicola]